MKDNVLLLSRSCLLVMFICNIDKIRGGCRDEYHSHNYGALAEAIVAVVSSPEYLLGEAAIRPFFSRLLSQIMLQGLPNIHSLT